MAIQSPNINTLINSINTKRNAGINATNAKLANIDKEKTEATYRYNNVATAENITTNLANLAGNMYQKTKEWNEEKERKRHNKIVEEGRAREVHERNKANALAKQEAEKQAGIEAKAKAEGVTRELYEAQKAAAISERQTKQYNQGTTYLNTQLVELTSIANNYSLAGDEMGMEEDGEGYNFGKSFNSKYESIIKGINALDVDDEVKTQLIEATDESVEKLKNSMIANYGEKLYNENRTLELAQIEIAKDQDIKAINFSAEKGSLNLIKNAKYLSKAEKEQAIKSYSSEIDVGRANNYYKNAVLTEGLDQIYIDIMDNGLIPDEFKNAVYTNALNNLNVEKTRAKVNTNENMGKMLEDPSSSISFGEDSFFYTGDEDVKLLSAPQVLRSVEEAYKDASPEIQAVAMATAQNAINNQIEKANVYKSQDQIDSMFLAELKEYEKELDSLEKTGALSTTGSDYLDIKDKLSAAKTNLITLNTNIDNEGTTGTELDATVTYEVASEFLSNQENALVSGQISAEEYIKKIRAYNLIDFNDNEVTILVKNALTAIRTYDGKNPIIPIEIKNKVSEFMVATDKIIDGTYDDAQTCSDIKDYYKAVLFNSFYKFKDGDVLTQIEEDKMFKDAKTEINSLLSAKEFDNIDKMGGFNQFRATNIASFGIFNDEITGEQLVITPEVQKVYDENEIFLRTTLEKELGSDFRIASEPTVPKVGEDGKNYAVPSIKVFDKNGNSTYYSIDSKGNILRLNEKWDSWITTDIKIHKMSESTQAIVDKYDPRNHKEPFKVDQNSKIHPLAQKYRQAYM